MNAMISISGLWQYAELKKNTVELITGGGYQFDCFWVSVKNKWQRESN